MVTLKFLPRHHTKWPAPYDLGLGDCLMEFSHTYPDYSDIPVPSKSL